MNAFVPIPASADAPAVSTFDFNGMDLRVVDLDGDPWFVAKDALNAIGLPQNAHGHATKTLSDDERILYQIQRGVRSQNIISESGLYKLIMRSDKPQAKAFQDWVTRDVLPTISVKQPSGISVVSSCLNASVNKSYGTSAQKQRYKKCRRMPRKQPQEKYGETAQR